MVVKGVDVRLLHEMTRGRHSEM